MILFGCLHLTFKAALKLWGKYWSVDVLVVNLVKLVGSHRIIQLVHSVLFTFETSDTTT